MNKYEELVLKQFNLLKPHLNKWGKMVDDVLVSNILPDFIKEHQIKILPNYRLKDDKSYLYKALYRKKNYSNPIENIEDKIGTRIIVLKSDDIELIQQKILNYSKWTAKITKNINQEIEEKPNIFDYQSVHIVVCPTENNDFFSTQLTKSLTCEIQIRTLLQHAFAEVSHDSTYKGPYKNDKDILRRLAKAMALMEATDDYFCNIFKLMADERRHYVLYLNELTRLYKLFNRDFDKSEINHFVTDCIFDLLELKSIQMTELETFVVKYQDMLTKCIHAKNGLLFQQPTIILALYFFINHRTFLRDNWTLNNEVLKTIYKATGTSYDNF